MNNTIKSILLVVFAGAFLAGCTTTVGSAAPQTNFTFPNSNVIPLGSVQAERSYGRFLIPHFITAEEVEELKAAALSQAPGADLLINYRIDTSLTTFPYYYRTTLRISGTAASMDVGIQDLQ